VQFSPKSHFLVSQSPRLKELDRERFSDAVEASYTVSSRQQLFVWTQSAFQALIPHEILICGIDDGSRQGIAMHRFSATRYFRQEHFDVIADPSEGLVPLLLSASEARRNAVVFCPAATPLAIDEDLAALVSDNELKNLAAHLIVGTRGRVEAFYAFSRVSSEFDTRLAYLIELLVPHLHIAFLRVLSTERDASSVHTQRAGRLVTPRQQEILSLIKAGKTNSEIAELLSCSQWTIKNHVQAILRKLDSTTRTHAIARAMSLGILHPD
jgi:transcriptional regulator EpsA